MEINAENIEKQPLIIKYKDENCNSEKQMQ